jgi:cell fate regulator YaaT (PSP1 superfamily)
VRNIVGVKYAAAGKIYQFDAGDLVFERGDDVVVETDRGSRLGTVAIQTVRKPHTHRSLKRALRHPSQSDMRTLDRNGDKAADALAMARSRARELKMPIKVFRAAYGLTGNKLQIYFTAEERIDFRGLVRDLSAKLHCRIEMRQTGVRDEAKMLGGIGSCGRELCCTTWMPDFVPVSIKMAKDQGLVLNPTKVSGQCGRLKCCLVYEQAVYAEMRKGLPRLGKRVITDDGEGRVVEVDVLRQRIRVSLGGGNFNVYGADEVKPMFPSQQPKPPKQKKRPPDETNSE